MCVVECAHLQRWYICKEGLSWDDKHLECKNVPLSLCCMFLFPGQKGQEEWPWFLKVKTQIIIYGCCGLGYLRSPQEAGEGWKWEKGWCVHVCKKDLNQFATTVLGESSDFLRGCNRRWTTQWADSHPLGLKLVMKPRSKSILKACRNFLQECASCCCCRKWELFYVSLVNLSGAL